MANTSVYKGMIMKTHPVGGIELHLVTETRPHGLLWLHACPGAHTDYILGRSNEVSEGATTIPIGVQGRVISRQHILIRVGKDGKEVKVRDLNSSHGTRLVSPLDCNGQRQCVTLVPGLFYKVETGDRLFLGKDIYRSGRGHAPVEYEIKVLPKTPTLLDVRAPRSNALADSANSSSVGISTSLGTPSASTQTATQEHATINSIQTSPESMPLNIPAPVSDGDKEESTNGNGSNVIRLTDADVLGMDEAAEAADAQASDFDVARHYEDPNYFCSIASDPWALQRPVPTDELPDPYGLDLAPNKDDKNDKDYEQSSDEYSEEDEDVEQGGQEQEGGSANASATLPSEDDELVNEDLCGFSSCPGSDSEAGGRPEEDPSELDKGELRGLYFDLELEERVLLCSQKGALRLTEDGEPIHEFDANKRRQNPSIESSTMHLPKEATTAESKLQETHVQSETKDSKDDHALSPPSAAEGAAILTAASTTATDNSEPIPGSNVATTTAIEQMSGPSTIPSTSSMALCSTSGGETGEQQQGDTSLRELGVDEQGEVGTQFGVKRSIDEVEPEDEDDRDATAEEAEPTVDSSVRAEDYSADTETATKDSTALASTSSAPLEDLPPAQREPSALERQARAGIDRLRAMKRPRLSVEIEPRRVKDVVCGLALGVVGTFFGLAAVGAAIDTP